MATHRCPSCGREIELAPECPHCGADQGEWADELLRIERAIADMKARDVAIAKEQKLIAQNLQAALFKRDILAHANDEKLKQARRTRGVLRRRAGRRPPTADPTSPRIPRQASFPRHRDRTEPPPPPSPPPPVTEPEQPAARPEASSREVQNILLGLGALLLGVAAVVFAGLAISTLDDISRIAILVSATGLMLAASPLVARRGLTSTAETIAAVGLLLVPLDGYALWALDAVRDNGLPGAVFAGLVFAITAVVGGAYATATGLSVPRYATVLALQPVLPLLAHEWIVGPAGWALTYAAVAIQDFYLARLVDRGGWPRLRAPAADPLPPPIQAERPESAPEEADAVISPLPPDVGPGAEPDRGAAGDGEDAAGQDSPAVSVAPATIFWLRELTWILHGLATGAALVFSVTGLVDAHTVPAATRAALVLLLAAAVGLAGAATLNRPPLPDLAAGVMTLAIIGAASRVAALALPGRSLLLIAVVIALTGLGVRALPERARRGPQLASAAALIVIGVVVAGAALRAALGPVRAALPLWHADLATYPEKLAAAVGPADWQLAVSALLLTFAAELSIPPEARREFTVAGAALTALATPASLGLPWQAAPWLPLLAAIAIGATGLYAHTERAAQAHVVGAALVGLAGAGASLARPGLTAAALFILSVAGLLIAVAPQVAPTGPGSDVVADWAAGTTALALPGAVASAAVAMHATPAAVLAASFLTACVTLGYAAITQVERREISAPLALSTGLGALAVTAAAFGARGATVADAWVGALLLVAAVLLFLAPSIDVGRRADRLLDGSDLAAAAVAGSLVATMARIAAILLPGAELAATAGLLLLVAVGVRAMPAEWRRGPILGVALSGGVLAVIAGYDAVVAGLRVLATPGPLWAANLDVWPVGGGHTAWQAPIALVLLAAAATVVLPRPAAYDVAAVCIGLATIGTPAALGLPWWSPIVVGGTVATVYGLAAVVASDPRAGYARATVAAGVALHGVGASLVRPWTTAAALAVVALVGVVVAALARVVAPLMASPHDRENALIGQSADGPALPDHLGQIGGAATGGALLALPGAVAALAAQFGWSADIVLIAGLTGSSLGLAILAAVRRQVPQYLPYATVGIAGGATLTAIASLPTNLPTGVYAAAAALLGVIAELLRAATPLPSSVAESAHHWSMPRDGTRERSIDIPLRPQARWSVSPATGAIMVAALPTALAVAAIAPALVAALFDPFKTLGRIWRGAPPALVEPAVGATDGTHVLAALLLTIAAALAAIGFGGRRFAHAVPVVLPGAAITLLIAPVSLGADWPASTMAALAVFTMAMLGLALTPPPGPAQRARPLRVARNIVFVIGLAAGNAGLAGSLATKPLTLGTLAGSVAIGAVAAVAGRSQPARILGWLFAAVFAQLFVLTAGLIAGLEPAWSAFGVLAVGAVLLVVAATLPRLRRPEAFREAATVEWTGYAAALMALALAFNSPRHVAALLAAWGAVLGVSATRPDRRPTERRTLFWASVGCEISAWWLLMSIANVTLPEAYTLPFAALALLIGLLELRQRPDLGSWTAYGPALVSAFLPTLVIVLATTTSELRELLLLLGAVATLIVGSMRQQQAPVVIGAIVTAITALHALTLVGPWLALIPVGIVLLALGANNERRRRTQERLRGALRGMR